MRGYFYLKTFVVVTILIVGDWVTLLRADKVLHSKETSFITEQIEIGFDGTRPNILSVKEVSITRKSPTSFVRPEEKSPYLLEWRTSKGKVSHSERIPGFENHNHHGESSNNSRFVYRLKGPKRAYKVSLSITKNDTKEVLDTFYLKNQTDVLTPVAPPNSKLSKASFSGSGVTKIHDTGEDSNRFVIVFMSDGYTVEDLKNGKYERDVARLLQAFKTKEPWGTLLNGTNIYRVDVSSKESGADVPEEGILRETYFESTFSPPPLGHLLVLGPNGVSKAVSIADAEIGPGVWDQIVVVVNSQKYGGSGGAVAVTSTSEDGPLVLLHELGHSFARLADEYSYESFSGPITAPEPNVDTNPLSPKWAAWINPNTPLPTAASGSEVFPDLLEVVGAFEGARYHSTGVYRPAATCAMRDIYAEFCPVCREAHLQKYLTEVKLDDAVYPPIFTKQVLSEENSNFSVSSVPVAGKNYVWRLCGKELTKEKENTISLASSALVRNGCTLELHVELSSKYLRSQNVTSKYRWSVCKKEGQCPKLFKLATRRVENSWEYSVSGVKSCQNVSVLTSNRRTDFKKGNGVVVFNGTPKGNVIRGRISSDSEVEIFDTSPRNQYISLLCDGNFTGEIGRLK